MWTFLRQTLKTNIMTKLKKPILFFTCALILFLVSESWTAPKNKLMARNWGPQSMLYLKGRHGRSFAPDYEEDYQKQILNSWNAVLKNSENSWPRKLMNFRRRHLPQNVDFLYLE
ncbi:spexin prohormone 2-like [Pelodytes ibericus]